MLATAADDVRIWNADSLQLLGKFYLNSSSRTRTATVSWSSNGCQLACTAKAESVIHLASFIDRDVCHTRANIGRPCSSAQFSRCSDRRLAVGCCDGSVLLWDIKQDRPSASLQVRSAAVTRLSFSTDDGFLAAAAADGTLCFYNMGTKHWSKSLTQPSDKVVTGLQCSALQRYWVASSWTDGTVRIWDAGSQRLATKMLLHPRYSCSGVAVSPQLGTLLATVGMDKQLVLSDSTSGRVQSSVQCSETLEAVDFTRDSRCAVVGGTSGKVYVYDLRNMATPLPETLSGHMGPVSCVQYCQTAVSWKPETVSLDTTPLVTLTEVPPDMTSPDTPSQNSYPHGTSSGDAVGKVSERGNSQEDHGLSGLDLSALSSCNSSSHRPFRLSDVMPQLMDSMTSSPITHSGIQNISVFDASCGLNGAQSPPGAPQPAPPGAPQPAPPGAPQPAPPGAPQAAHDQNQLPNGGPQQREAGTALATLREELYDGFDDLRHQLANHEYCTMMQHLAFRREVLGMLQRMSEDIQAVRNNLEELQMD